MSERFLSKNPNLLRGAVAATAVGSLALTTAEAAEAPPTPPTNEALVHHTASFSDQNAARMLQEGVSQRALFKHVPPAMRGLSHRRSRSHSHNLTVNDRPPRLQLHHSAPAHTTVSRENPNHYSAARQKWLFVLRQCESGGNYQINTGNGFEGGYQFSPSTWDTLHTGYAHAYESPPAVQDRAIVENTERSSGGLATQNPGCYSSQVLAQFPPK